MIELNRVTKSFDEGKTFALKEVSFCLHSNEILVLLGSSGSGKTTVCRMVRGLLPVSEGTILFEGKEIGSLGPSVLQKAFGCVFQDVGLFPHLTVEENLLIVGRVDVFELLKQVGLAPEVYKGRYPHQLSGGERQRVGIARALSTSPRCLLMDEPFAALDPISRSQLQEEILALKAKIQTGILFITHDIFEAMYLADRIAILNQGVLDQIGTKEEIFSSPQTPFVAELTRQVSEILGKTAPSR